MLIKKTKEYFYFFENYSKEYIKIAKNDSQRIQIQRKIDHSYRVNKIALKIAKKLKLNRKDTFMINIISLLHDLGRFEQFYKYNTYVDKLSERHALISIKVLEEKQILKKLDDIDKNLVIESIRLHDIKTLPKGLDKKLFLYATILRDADKIDWLYAMVNIIPKLPIEHQKVFYSDKPNVNEVSNELVEEILNKKTVVRSDLNTVCELQLSGLGFITSDFKYKPSIEIIKKEKIIEKAYLIMNKNEKVNTVYNFVLNYVGSI